MYNHRVFKYLFLLPIILMVAFSLFFYHLTEEINNELLHEKFVEKRTNIDLIDTQIDRFIEIDADWGKYDYQSIIAYNMQYIDELPMTFAATYDENFKPISERSLSYENAPFEPVDYPEFIQAAANNEKGELILKFKPANDIERDMHVYYRWVPSDSSLDNRFLTVVAISKYSITTVSEKWIGYGALALIIITTILNFTMVALICRLGQIYMTRSQKYKWRGVQ